MPRCKSSFGFCFSWCIALPFYHWLSPEHMVRKGGKNRKKLAVTAVIRFVSWFFDYHNDLDCRQYEEKNGGIGLLTDNKQEQCNGVQQQGYSASAGSPNGMPAVLKDQGQNAPDKDPDDNKKIDAFQPGGDPVQRQQADRQDAAVCSLAEEGEEKEENSTAIQKSEHQTAEAAFFFQSIFPGNGQQFLTGQKLINGN